MGSIVLAVESLGCKFRSLAPTSKLGTAGWSVTPELGRNETDRPQGSLGSRRAKTARFRFSGRPCCSQTFLWAASSHIQHGDSLLITRARF